MTARLYLKATRAYWNGSPAYSLRAHRPTCSRQSFSVSWPSLSKWKCCQQNSWLTHRSSLRSIRCYLFLGMWWRNSYHITAVHLLRNHMNWTILKKLASGNTRKSTVPTRQIEWAAYSAFRTSVDSKRKAAVSGKLLQYRAGPDHRTWQVLHTCQKWEQLVPGKMWNAERVNVRRQRYNRTRSTNL